MNLTTERERAERGGPRRGRPGIGAGPLPRTRAAGAAAAEQGHRVHRAGARVFGLRGLLPPRVRTLEEQVALEIAKNRRKGDELERFIGLAALQDRNETLFYRVLLEHLEELMPIVYTPVVGRACQEYSHIMRRSRGLWLTPEDIDRIPELLANSGQDDVRLIVATDNERILGLGDQGCGGMGIPVGKLALYTAGAGIHPSLSLPVSLDVGTDNRTLLDDPDYVGYRQPRLRGPAYDGFIEAFVEGVIEVFPHAVLQWEDFKQHNAIRLLDRYRHRITSFNDDIQGTAAVVLAGIRSALRILDEPLPAQRFVFLGAGAASIGIARLVRVRRCSRRARRRMSSAGDRGARLPGTHLSGPRAARPRQGGVRARPGRADGYRFAPAGVWARGGREAGRPELPHRHERYARDLHGGGHPRDGGPCEDAGDPAAVEPHLQDRGTPKDILEWTDGRAIVATGSPFPPVVRGERAHVIGQANNAFCFPGIGLGALVAEAREITDEMFLSAAEALAGTVSRTARGRRSTRTSPNCGSHRAPSRSRWRARRGTAGSAGTCATTRSSRRSTR